MYPTPFPELLLGRLIGRGSYGRVHVGLFRGREVAIKVCCALAQQCSVRRSASQAVFLLCGRWPLSQLQLC